MATAKYCDVCGELINDDNNLRYIEFWKREGSDTKPTAPMVECCPVCNEKIKQLVVDLKTYRQVDEDAVAEEA